jgi:hypothetical protein
VVVVVEQRLMVKLVEHYYYLISLVQPKKEIFLIEVCLDLAKLTTESLDNSC